MEESNNFDKFKLNEEGLKKVQKYAQDHHISEAEAKIAIMRELINKARQKH